MMYCRIHVHIVCMILSCVNVCFSIIPFFCDVLYNVCVICVHGNIVLVTIFPWYIVWYRLYRDDFLICTVQLYNVSMSVVYCIIHVCIMCVVQKCVDGRFSVWYGTMVYCTELFLMQCTIIIRCRVSIGVYYDESLLPWCTVSTGMYGLGIFMGILY